MRNAYIIAANTLREALGQKLILLFALVAVALDPSMKLFLRRSEERRLVNIVNSL